MFPGSFDSVVSRPLVLLVSVSLSSHDCPGLRSPASRYFSSRCLVHHGLPLGPTRRPRPTHSGSPTGTGRRGTGRLCTGPLPGQEDGSHISEDPTDLFSPLETAFCRKRTVGFSSVNISLLVTGSLIPTPYPYPGVLCSSLFHTLVLDPLQRISL